MEALGRPMELTHDQLEGIMKGYTHNIPAPEVASFYNISRQRVYYYFKKFKADGLGRERKMTFEDLLV